MDLGRHRRRYIHSRPRVHSPSFWTYSTSNLKPRRTLLLDCSLFTPSYSAHPTVSVAPSSEPTMYPTAALSMYPTITPRASVFSFLLRIEGGYRGCNSDGLNDALLDPNLANQVSGRRLGLGTQDVCAIDPSSGMVTERRLQEENQQDDCVYVAEAEKRGPRVSLHCILLLDFFALPRDIRGLT
jgi:hypothetical protein